MVSVAYSEAFVEVLAIIDNTPPEEKKTIPQKFLDFLRENASQTYKFTFDSNKELTELDLKLETKGILSVIYYNYLCPEDKKEEYLQILENNQKLYEEEKREKYNPDNIFKNNFVENTGSVAKEVALTEYKESIFKKIINKIKKFIHI